jgi:hypothetical protein
LIVKLLHAVLAGLAGRDSLRGMLRRLGRADAAAGAVAAIRQQFLAGVIWGGRQEERGTEFEGAGILGWDVLIPAESPGNESSGS